MKRSILSALLVGALGSVASAQINTFGSTGQFAIDSNFDVNGVSVVKASNPGTNPSVGTFGHGRDGFGAVTSVGTLFNPGGGAGQALYIGDSYSAQSRAAFDHSIVFLSFQTPVFNNPGKDVAIMLGSGIIPSSQGSGPYVETLAIGVDPSIASGNYSNTLYYNAPVDYTNNLSGTNGYLTFTYDLGDLGVAPGASVSGIYVSNFDVVSTVSGLDGLSGWVDLAGTSGTLIEGGSIRVIPGAPPQPNGTNSYYVSTTNGLNTHFDTDPDIIYAGGLVPEPGTMIALGAGALALIRRRKTAK